MNILLLFLALPISTIILAIVLQKILRCPILVAATFFAIYLIVAYAVFDSSFLIFVIIYTILAYVTAVLTRLICNILERINRCGIGRDNCDNCNICNTSNTNTSNCNNVGRTSFTVTTNEVNPVLFLSNRNNTTRRNCCNCSRR